MTDLDNTSFVWVIIEQSYHYKESTVLYFVTPFTTISVVLCLVRAISIFIFFYLIFNYEFWTKCTVSRISKVNYENVYIFGIKLFNFIVFSTHQIWDLDSTKIQISTVLFVIVANIFHFDYQYTFTAPNIANPRLIASTFCVMSLLFWDIYVKILKSLNDWLFRVILLLGDAPSSEFALL